MTKDELKAVLVKRIAPKLRASLVWSDVTAAVGVAPEAAKDAIVAAIRDGNPKALGETLIGIVGARILTVAATEADTLLADNSLTMVELERVL